MEALTDNELLQRIALGDQEAFALLYDRYGKPAYSLAYRIVSDGHDAEDVVQDAFLSVWRMARSFDVRRGNARSWLLSVVHHRAVDIMRRRRGQPPLFPSSESIPGQAEFSDVWREVLDSIDGEMVRKALARIPEDQRRTIELAFFGGYTHREIAQKEDIPLGTVKSRIRVGMDKLRELLKELASRHMAE